MAQYLGIRIVDSQTVEKVFHRLLLFGSAGVGRVAVLVKTSLITDADAVGIVVMGMSAYLVLWTTWIEHAILRDVVVVADVLEASCLVAGFQLLYAERADDGGEDGDDEIYYFLDGFFLHDFSILMVGLGGFRGPEGYLLS